MIGVGILILAVVAVIVSVVTGLARQGSAKARLRQAAQAVGSALDAGSPEAVGARMREMASRAHQWGSAEAGAHVLAARQTRSREVIPLLVALLAHPAEEVARDAALALNDEGAPGLRAVWQAVESGAGAPPLGGFLLQHPDWLFEQLLRCYVSEGARAVRRHETLWREDGMRARLALLRQGSDEVNRLRAEGIAQVLGLDGDGNGDRVA